MASPRSADRLPFIGPDGCRIIASHARANSSGIQTTNNPHLEMKHEIILTLILDHFLQDHQITKLTGEIQAQSLS